MQPIVANFGYMNVVLDTNILISACWKPDGLEARTINLAFDGAFRLCATPEVWTEYRDVVTRDKFVKIRARAAGLIDRMEACAETLSAPMLLDVASDPDDNRFLECAVAAKAEYLVTGNRKHYPAAMGCTSVVNAREFLVKRFGLAPPPL